MDEGLRRLAQRSGFADQVRTQIFVTSCQDSASPSPQLCAGLPSADEVMATAKWSMAQCTKRGYEGSQPCAQLMNVVAARCRKASK